MCVQYVHVPMCAGVCVVGEGRGQFQMSFFQILFTFFVIFLKQSLSGLEQADCFSWTGSLRKCLLSPPCLCLKMLMILFPGISNHAWYRWFGLSTYVQHGQPLNLVRSEKSQRFNQPETDRLTVIQSHNPSSSWSSQPRRQKWHKGDMKISLASLIWAVENSN